MSGTRMRELRAAVMNSERMRAVMNPDRLRAAMNEDRVKSALVMARITSAAFVLTMIYRHRKRIKASLSGGILSVRKTASNVNDLLFSSSSLASSFATDLKTYMYGESRAVPTSLHRLIDLLCSDEVQKSIHGTSQTLLAAVYAARRKDAQERKARGETEVDTVGLAIDAVLDKLFSPQGHALADSALKSASSAFLSFYLSLPPTPPTAPPPPGFPSPAVQMAVAILDRLATPQGRQLSVSTASAFATAIAPPLAEALAGGGRGSEPAPTPEGSAGGGGVLDKVLEWVVHPSTRDGAQALISETTSRAVHAAVGAAMAGGGGERGGEGGERGGRERALERSRRAVSPRVRGEHAGVEAGGGVRGAAARGGVGVGGARETEHNPGSSPSSPRVTSGGRGGGIAGGSEVRDDHAGEGGVVSILVAVSERPECRGLIVEMAGACVREGVGALLAGPGGRGWIAPSGTGAMEQRQGNKGLVHSLRRASYEAFALLVVVLGVGMVQGWEIFACSALAVWCVGLLVLAGGDGTDMDCKGSGDGKQEGGESTVEKSVQERHSAVERVDGGVLTVAS